MNDQQPIKILIVDDEPQIVEFISYVLRKKGFETAGARDGNEAIRYAKSFRPKVILMDIMMPHKDGIQAVKELRCLHEFDETVIIFLTAKVDEQFEIEGLQIGADDYITKPIKPELLATRISHALRRTKKETKEADAIHVSGIEINRTNYSVSFNGQNKVLPRKEFELLALLASQPGRVFLRNEILQRVWGSDVIVGDRTIDVHIRKIRQKMGIDCIATVKGVGYKFEIA
ncbi:MAG: response regulator transcription factor [Bacteroidetes bacterium]|nr:response regulator transcription factor [Bacteroidota bacterium]MBS1740322.1 response regulator transcription factor [Bacteroidota bacterium]